MCAVVGGILAQEIVKVNVSVEQKVLDPPHHDLVDVVAERTRDCLSCLVSVTPPILVPYPPFSFLHHPILPNPSRWAFSK